MSFNFKYKIPCLILIAMITWVALPHWVSAVSPSQISIDTIPTNPSAGQNFTVSLNSYSADLDTILISWFVNGKKVSSEIGMKSMSATAPAASSSSTIRAVLSFPDGEVEKRVTIRPSPMTILWQATDSYVPPFYRGKAMPTAESEIKVVALPEIKSGVSIVSPKNLVYTWKLNYENEADASGYGKNAFTYVNDYLEDLDNISVTASTIDGKFSSSNNVNISASQPQISFYKNDSLLGIIWEQALSDGHKMQNGQDETIVAEPYFVSPKEIWSPSLVWNWFINGNLTNNIFESQKNWLPIKVEGDVTGTSTIGVSLENKTQLLGNTSKQINIEY